MSTTPILPQQLALALPVLVTMIAGYLGTWRLPTWLNEIIVLVVLIASVAAWVALGGTFSNDLITDIMLIAGYSAALVAGPLAPLRQWLVINVPSPLHLVVKPATAASVLGLPLPGSASSSVPARASAITAGGVEQGTTMPQWVVDAKAAAATTGTQSGDEAHAG